MADITNSEWRDLVGKARILDPDDGRLLGYVHDGKAYGTIDALRLEVKKSKMDICGCHGVRRYDCSYYQRAKFGYSYSDIDDGFSFSRSRHKTIDGVELTSDGERCRCHYELTKDCPTLLKKALDRTKKEHTETKLQVRKLTQELEARPVVTTTKEVKVPGKDVVRIEYRDKVENVENDPQYNIQIQNMYLAEAEKRRVQANILSVLFVLGIAGATPFLMLTLWAFVPIGILALSLGIANGARVPAGLILERKELKLKWEARQNLALQSQMQSYLSEPTTGSTLPTTSGTVQKRLPM